MKRSYVINIKERAEIIMEMEQEVGQLKPSALALKGWKPAFPFPVFGFSGFLAIERDPFSTSLPLISWHFGNVMVSLFWQLRIDFPTKTKVSMFKHWNWMLNSSGSGPSIRLYVKLEGWKRETLSLFYFIFFHFLCMMVHIFCHIYLVYKICQSISFISG